MKKKKILLKLIVAGLITIMPFQILGCSKDKVENKVNLRILSITDMHSNLMNYDYYTDKVADDFGVVKIASLIKNAKDEVDANGNKEDEVDNVIVLDNGDTIQGTPLGDYYGRVNPPKEGEENPIYKTLEELRFDASILGNHEFNYGLDYIENAISSSKMPIINSNIYTADGKDTLFKPYTIINEKVVNTDGKEETVKIGVIGFVPPQILNWDKALLEGKLTVKDIKESAEEVVKKIEGETDIIVALCHSGFGEEKYEKNSENQAYELTKIKGIDAVVVGHSHDRFPSENYDELPKVNKENGTVNNIPTVQPLNNARDLGIIDLSLVKEKDSWKVESGTSKLVSAKGVENDTVTEEFIKPYHEATLKYVSEAVGNITKDTNSYFSLVADNTSVQIVSDAQKKFVQGLLDTNFEQLKDYTKLPLLSAAAPFKAGLSEGGVNPKDYVDLKAGDIKIKDVSNLYKYPNVLSVVKIKGSEVKEWLEMCAGLYNKIDTNKSDSQDLINTNYPAFNYDTLDGVTYEIDVTKDPKYSPSGEILNKDSSRIVNLMYNGKAIDMEQEFLVVTNNYRAGGGGNFPGLADGSKIVYISSDETRQIVSDYIKSNSPLTPNKDNNWKLILNGSKGKFISNKEAKNYISEYNNITLSKELDNDGAEYIIQ